MKEFQTLLEYAGISGDPQRLLTVFGLAFARAAPVVSFSPFLGGQAVSVRIKAGLAILLGLTLLPGLMALSPGPLPSAGGLLLLLIKELMAGLLLGFVVQVPFYALQMAGTILDTQRGMNQISYLAPQLSGHTSAFGSLSFQTAIVIFLAMNGHLRFLEQFALTFTVLPPLELPLTAPGLSRLPGEFALLTGRGLKMALQLAAPVVIAVFLVDAASAALGKATPRLQVSGEMQTLKSLAGLGILLLSVAFLAGEVERELAELLGSIQRFMSFLG
jgi:flagellar biosynthetic protein FliR